MTTADLIKTAESNQWGAIAPELVLGCLALLLLVLEIVLPKKSHGLIPGVAILGQLGVLIGLFVNAQNGFLGHETFAGLLRHSPLGQFMRVFFVLTSILVSVLGTIALAKQKMPKIEFFHIVIVITGGLGSMPGALLGGVLIGLTEALAGLLFTPSVKSMFAFAILVLVLLFRPQGIMGKKPS